MIAETSLAMPQTLIETGDKVHVITRRNFADDLRRHFAGTVQVADGSVVRAQGYTFVYNSHTNQYRRRPEVRSRIFDLSDAQLIVNVIHPDTDLEALVYVVRNERLVITDDAAFTLDVNEFGATS